jgi:hypothetical protein
MPEPVCKIVPPEFERAMLSFSDEFTALMHAMPAQELMLMVPCIKKWNVIQGLMAGLDPYQYQTQIDTAVAELHAKLHGMPAEHPARKGE